LAQVYIHASTTDQWGLVVNEAMASGLPVIVSDRCGCAPDLVSEGDNGYTFDPYNVNQLAELMIKMDSNDVDIKAMGRTSQNIISNWSPERFAQNLIQASGAAIKRPLKNLNIVDKILLKALAR
jgi:glycosyltransferase involved in cell wall biosynthesis